MVVNFAMVYLLIGLTMGIMTSVLAGLGIMGFNLMFRCDELRRIARRAERSRGQAESAHKEARADLAASQLIIEDFAKDIHDLSSQVADGRTKDALIEALTRRVSNTNAEYNNKRLTHNGTTLADVYKLTGEGNV